MLIKAKRAVTTPIKPKFEIHGEMAQNFLEQMIEEDYYDPRDDWF
jgi:hypothetical protein